MLTADAESKTNMLNKICSVYIEEWAKQDSQFLLRFQIKNLFITMQGLDCPSQQLLNSELAIEI